MIPITVRIQTVFGFQLSELCLPFSFSSLRKGSFFIIIVWTLGWIGLGPFQGNFGRLPVHKGLTVRIS